MQSFDEHCSCVKESSLIENNQYRVGSEKYFEYFRDVREAYHAGELTVDPSEIDIIEGNLGEFATFKGENVALDCIFEEEEKNPPLNKPKVGGAKKYYVYVYIYISTVMLTVLHKAYRFFMCDVYIEPLQANPATSCTIEARPNCVLRIR